MAWYGGAIHRPVTRFNPGGSIAQQITPRRFVFHTAVSGASSLFDYFNQSGNPCSHFYVRADGTVEQYVDTGYRAPAQLDGNHDCIGVETQDMGDGFPAWSGSDVPAWSAAQMAALANLSAWVASVHGIPLTQLPDSVNGRTGFGYHRQGINPWRVPNGELWSNSTGKVCPGDRRIAQIPGILTQAATGDDMTPEQAATLDQIAWTVGQMKPETDRIVLVQAAADQAAWGVNDPVDGARAKLDVLLARDPLDSVPALAEALAPLIIAALPPPTELTQAQIQAACEAGMRAVLGGLDNPPT